MMEGDRATTSTLSNLLKSPVGDEMLGVGRLLESDSAASSYQPTFIYELNQQTFLPAQENSLANWMQDKLPPAANTFQFQSNSLHLNNYDFGFDEFDSYFTVNDNLLQFGDAMSYFPYPSNDSNSSPFTCESVS